MVGSLKRHESIKMRLRLAGSSLADIARELGVSASTVTTVSQGYRRSARIQTAIAAKLRVSATELWAEQYTLKASPAPRKISTSSQSDGSD